MHCPACNTENPPQARFCMGCAAPLARRCSACGTALPEAARFCMECGAAQVSGVGLRVSAARSPTPDTYTPRHLAEKILASRDVLAGERKQVTVLFADVVGSTELIRGRDAEEAQRLLDGVVQVMMDAVHRYEGTVSRLMGDGLMAMFGAPVAHEDHAVRACYAALAMLEAARRHAEGLRRSVGFTVAIRVGLSAGEVVVRTISDDLHMDYTAMGETVHLAARMEQLANPGTAVLTAETLALVEGYVQVRSLGPVPVKGVGEAVEVFQLVGAGLARTRLQAAASRGLTRFVGRQAELEAMYRALGQAEAGRGQVIALVGEPGVGKSRLVWELTHSHRTEGWTVLESGSVSYGKATSYLPVIDLLKAYCRIESRDDERTIREKVAGKLLMLDRALEPTLPALLALLDAGERPSPPAPLPAAGEGSRSSVSPSPALRERGSGGEGSSTTWELLDPAQRRRQTLDALKRILLRESHEQPLLLVFEDLHWIDSETQALLDSLVDSVPTARILLLVNFRPEYRHDWGNRGAYTQIRVDPLGAESAGDLLDGLLGADPSLAPLKALLTTRTDGNPFFLEESVRSLVESGQLIGERGAYRLAGPLASVRVPATVQAVLAARIDRLPPDAKELLQTAAAIGKDVPDALLRAVAEPADGDLQRTLAQLQAAEFLYEASLFPELEYTFKHALTHEVTYGSLLQDRRRALHGRALEAIERLYPDRQDEHVERLAHHALRAERWPEAVTYARAAGQKTSARSAYREAASWFEQALDGLRHLPETRLTLELAIDLRLVDLEIPFGALSIHARQLGNLREALEIAERLGDQRRQGAVHAAMTGFLAKRGRFDEAVEASQRALDLAEATGDRALHAFTMHQRGDVYRRRGDLREAANAWRHCINAPLTPEDLKQFGLGHILLTRTRSGLVWTLGDLGEFDDAIAEGAENIRRCEESADPSGVLLAWTTLARAYLERGDVASAEKLLIPGLEKVRAIDDQARIAWTLAERGTAYTLAGQPALAIPLLEEALALAAENMFAGLRPLWTTWLGETYLAAGRNADARRTAEDALVRATAQQDRANRAYALSALGEIAASETPSAVSGAEQRYREALALAEELEMRPLQARCHLGLGKLLQRVGRMDEAHAELSTAVTMLREMGMTYWLPEAEAALADVSLGARSS